MKLEAPQIIFFILMIIRITINGVKHGEDKDTKYDFWVQLAASAITFGLLYWGGFFS